MCSVVNTRGMLFLTCDVGQINRLCTVQYVFIHGYSRYWDKCHIWKYFQIAWAFVISRFRCFICTFSAEWSDTSYQDVRSLC